MNINRPRRTPEKRNTINDKRYNTGRWKRTRKIILERDGYLCQCEDCKKLPVPLIASVVDHDKPVTKGGSFWDFINLRSMNESCHQRKSQSEVRR